MEDAAEMCIYNYCLEHDLDADTIRPDDYRSLMNDIQKAVLDTAITLYHASNVNAHDIGAGEKKTMFFTSDRQAAEDWGDEHYAYYNIFTVKVPVRDIEIFKPLREGFTVSDFEMLEAPEIWPLAAQYWANTNAQVVCYPDCTDGFIFRDITKYKVV